MYSSRLTRRTDNLANILLWTVVECSLGIIAGSLPVVRQIFNSLTWSGSSAPAKLSPSKDLEFQTIGRVRARHNPMYDTDLVVTVVGGGTDVEIDNDDESTKRMIKVKTAFERISVDAIRDSLNDRVSK